MGGEEDIQGAGGGHKNYGPLNYESAPGWDRASVDALMSNDVPTQELAQSNVAAPDMTKDYIDRYFGFLPPTLIKNLVSHEKSRRRQRIDAYFRTEHERLPPRISRLLYGSYTPPEYRRRPVASPSVPPPPPSPAYYQHPKVLSSPLASVAAPSPAPSSVGSSLDELVRELISTEQVQQHEIRSAQNVVNDLDTILEVLNSGVNDVKEHLLTAASPQESPPSQPSQMNDDYLTSLMDDLPSFDFGEQQQPSLPSSSSPADVTSRYIAMNHLGAPPSSPPLFDDDDEDSLSSLPTQQQQQSSSPLPLSQHIARKSMSNIARKSMVTPTPGGDDDDTRTSPVSDVHKLLRTVFRDHATGKRNTTNATHKILDIAHNITKEHIQ